MEGTDPLDSMGIPFVIKNRKGAERIVEIASSPIVNERKQTQGIVLALRDITRKTEVEKEINRISKMESLGLLAGGIAHDFNNVLTAIIGNMSVARTLVENDERLHGIFSEIEEAGKKASTLSHQLLTFARGGEPVKETADILEFVRENAEYFFSGFKPADIHSMPERICGLLK